MVDLALVTLTVWRKRLLCSQVHMSLNRVALPCVISIRNFLLPQFTDTDRKLNGMGAGIARF